MLLRIIMNFFSIAFFLDFILNYFCIQSRNFTCYLLHLLYIKTSFLLNPLLITISSRNKFQAIEVNNFKSLKWTVCCTHFLGFKIFNPSSTCLPSKQPVCMIHWGRSTFSLSSLHPSMSRFAKNLLSLFLIAQVTFIYFFFYSENLLLTHFAT